MSGPPLVVRLLAEQRKRCLATIMTSAENSAWWPELEADEQDAFRASVRAAVSIFYDLARDIVKVADDSDPGMRNDLALDLIRSIHTQQQRLVAMVGQQQEIS